MMDSHTPARNTDPRSEGSRREELAAYFLSVPPYREQTPAQKADYHRHLRQLGTLEDEEVLRSAGANRPLVCGNPLPLLQNLLSAAQRLAAGVGQPLFFFPAREIHIDFPAMLHPRLLMLATVDLLRAACTAAPRSPVWVRICEQSSCLTVSVTAAEPFAESAALRVVKECAGLHGGSLAQCDRVIGFSVARATGTLPETAPYHCPTAAEFCRDTLSPVWTGFYAWLEPSPEADSSDG